MHLENTQEPNTSGISSESEPGKIKPSTTKRDFFGRIVPEVRLTSSDSAKVPAKPIAKVEERKVWVSFHEGFSK